MLGFDAGCMKCSEMARRIEERVGDRLEVESLLDPQVKEWRREVLGENAPWAPTLIEVRDGKVRAWTGIRLGLVLSRFLGPRDTWRVMKVLGEINAPPQAERTAAITVGGISRGQFLKGVGGAAVALSVLSTTGNLATSAEAATRTPTQRGGTNAQRLSAWKTAVTSNQFLRLDQEQIRLAGKSFESGYRDSWVTVRDDYATVTLASAYDERGKRGVVATFWVDLRQERVAFYNAAVSTPVAGRTGEMRVVIEEDGEYVHQVDLARNYVRLADGRKASLDQYKKSLDRFPPRPSAPTRSARISQAEPRAICGTACECTVSGFCGGLLALNCAVAPYLLGLTVIGGLGAAAFCYLVQEFGCGYATCKACGTC